MMITSPGCCIGFITGMLMLMLGMNPMLSNAQTASLKIEDQLSCENERVDFDLLPNGLDSLGALTIYLDYSPDCLVFDTLIVLNQAFSGLIYNDIEDANGEPIGRVGISWSGLSPVNPGSNSLAQASFFYRGIPTTLDFNSASEIADWMAQVLNVSFVSGSVSNAYEPQIISEPPVDILAYSEIQLEIIASPAESYQWQYLDGEDWINMTDGALVGGANAPILYLYYGSLGGFDRKIRCLISACTTIASSEIQIYWMISNPETDVSAPFDIIFDPIREKIQIEFNESKHYGNYHLEIFSINAKSQFEVLLNTSASFSLTDFSPGIYLISLRKSGAKEAVIRKKIVLSH